jgi:hypothetical protein
MIPPGSAPALVEMMGFLGMGNNPMVGVSVAATQSHRSRRFARVDCHFWGGGRSRREPINVVRGEYRQQISEVRQGHAP